MKAKKTPRGFVVVEHKEYVGKDGAAPQETRLIQESSAIGNYEDAMAHPGSSFLWIGQDHHLNREEVKELISRMNYWLRNGRLQEGPTKRKFAKRKLEQ